LILGVKGSPFDDALACGALDAAKKLGLHIDLFAPDHFTGESQADGQSVEKEVLADTAPVTSVDTAKAERYEYKSDCSLSY
jgi:ribose transport system substrate-binding protein